MLLFEQETAAQLVTCLDSWGQSFDVTGSQLYSEWFSQTFEWAPAENPVSNSTLFPTAWFLLPAFLCQCCWVVFQEHHLFAFEPIHSKLEMCFQKVSAGSADRQPLRQKSLPSWMHPESKCSGCKRKSEKLNLPWWLPWRSTWNRAQTRFGTRWIWQLQCSLRRCRRCLYCAWARSRTFLKAPRHELGQLSLALWAGTNELWKLAEAAWQHLRVCPLCESTQVPVLLRRCLDFRGHLHCFTSAVARCSGWLL